MNDLQNGFLAYAEEQLPRLLSLMDRNFFSESAGSFDRSYWHFKTSDFSSASLQMGAHSIALLFSNNKSKYYKDPYLKKLIELSIDYTQKIQKNDGTFDEWYFNERGWAGPTAYLVHSYCRIYLLCSNELGFKSIEKLTSIISKGAYALLTGNEKNIITNHIAIAATALYESWEITKNQVFKGKAEQLLQEVILNTDQEGWSHEYQAPDIGYQTATLSFLSYIHEFNKDKGLEDFAKNSLTFISFFIMPNGEIANTASSRYTVTHFFRAYEYWKDFSEIAKRISEIIIKHSPEPLIHQHEDHYFIYRLLEVLEASRLDKQNSTSTTMKLPSEQEEGLSQIFSNSQILIKSMPHYYWVIGLKQGLSVYGWSKRLERSIIDQGIVVKDSSRNIYISNVDQDSKLTQSSEAELSTLLWLKKHDPKYFSPIKLILFRFIFLIFGNNQKIAEFFKDTIKSILIKPKKKHLIQLTRSLFFQEDGALRVVNTLSSQKNLNGHYYCNGGYNYKFVPQSNYFRKTDFSNFQKETGKLNNTKEHKIEYLLKCADS